MSPLVSFLMAEPGMATRLLAQHADDGTGRCQVCSGGGQTGRHLWPCTIHDQASQARQHLTSRTR